MSFMPSDSRPLYSPEIEFVFLGAMTFSVRAADKGLMLVDESDLYRPAHRTMFRAMRELRRGGKEASLPNLRQELLARGELANVGGSEYLNELDLSVPDGSGVSGFAETILELSRLRRIQQSARDTLGKVDDHEGGSSADIASWASQEFQQVGGSAAGVIAMSEIDESGGDRGLSTGIRDVDARLETRGAPTGQMCVVVAEEKHGKSTELVGLAVHAAWELRGCLYVTLADLNPKRLKRKFLRARCGCSERETAVAMGREAEFVNAKYELERQVSLEILDRTRLGGDDVDQIVAAIETYRQRRMRSATPLQEVFVDYAQKLTAKGFPAAASVAMTNHCSKKISAYAETTDLVIWVGSQITQGNAKMGTRMITKGGRGWLEDCGLALLIEKLEDEERRKEGCDARMTITHSRFKGAGTVIDLLFDRDKDLLVPA